MVTNTTGSVNETTTNSKVKENGEIEKEALTKNDYLPVKSNSEEPLKTTTTTDKNVRTENNDMSSSEKQNFSHVPVSNGFPPNSSFNNATLGNGGSMAHVSCTMNGPQPNGPYPGYTSYAHNQPKQGSIRPPMHAMTSYGPNQRYTTSIHGGGTQTLGQLLAAPSRFPAQYPNYASHTTASQGDYSQNTQQNWSVMPPQYARGNEQQAESYNQQQHYNQHVRYMNHPNLPRYPNPATPASTGSVSSYQAHQVQQTYPHENRPVYPGSPYTDYHPSSTHNHIPQQQQHPFYSVRQQTQQHPTQYPTTVEPNQANNQPMAAESASRQPSRPSSTASAHQIPANDRSIMSPNRKAPQAAPNPSQPSTSVAADQPPYSGTTSSPQNHSRHHLRTTAGSEATNSPVATSATGQSKTIPPQSSISSPSTQTMPTGGSTSMARSNTDGSSLLPVSNAVSMPAYSSSLNRATNYPMHAPNYPQHSPQQMSTQQPIYPNQSNPRIQNVIPPNRPSTPVTPNAAGKPHHVASVNNFNSQPHTPQPVYSPAPLSYNTASPVPTPERRLSKQSTSSGVVPSPDSQPLRQGAAQAAAAAAIAAAAHTAQPGTSNVPKQHGNYYPNQQQPQQQPAVPAAGSSQQPVAPPLPPHQIPQTPQIQLQGRRVMTPGGYMPTEPAAYQPNMYPRMPHHGMTPTTGGVVPRMPSHPRLASSPGLQRMPSPASMYNHAYTNQPQSTPYPNYYAPTGADHPRLPSYPTQMNAYPAPRTPVQEDSKKVPQARSASQKLAALYEPADEPGRREFIDSVLKYWEDKNLPLKNAPLMGRKTLDLFFLYRLVKERGFMQEVTNQKKWNEISTLMKLHSSSTSGFTLKKQYCKYLYGFECRYERGEDEPQEALTRITEANRKKKNQADHVTSLKQEDIKNNTSPARIPTPSMTSRMPYNTMAGPQYSRYNPAAPVPSPNPHGYGPAQQHYPPHHNITNSMSPKPQIYGPQPLPAYPVHQQTANYPPPAPGSSAATVYPSMSQNMALQPIMAIPDKPPSRAPSDTMSPVTSTHKQPVPSLTSEMSDSNSPALKKPPGSDNCTDSPASSVDNSIQPGKVTPTPAATHLPSPMNKLTPQYKMPLPPQPVHPSGPNAGHMTYQPRPTLDPFNRPYLNSHQAMPPPTSYQYPNNASQTRQQIHPGPPVAYHHPQDPMHRAYQGQAIHGYSNRPYPHQQQSNYQMSQQSVPPSNIPTQGPLKRPGAELPGPPSKYPRPEMSTHYPPMNMRGFENMMSRHHSPYSQNPGPVQPGIMHPPPGSGGMPPRNHNLYVHNTSASMYQDRYKPRANPRMGWRASMVRPRLESPVTHQHRRMTRNSSLAHLVRSRAQPIFPAGCVEATEPKLTKFHRKTCREVGSLEAWKVIMSLKSGLLVESTWALNVLTILLYDNQTVHQFKLSQLPGLLDSLVDHCRKLLAEFFSLPNERKVLGVEDCVRSYLTGKGSSDEDDEITCLNQSATVVKSKSKSAKKKRTTQMVTSKLHSKFNKLPVKIETATNPFVVDKSSVWDHINQLNGTDDLSHIVVSFLQDKVRKDPCGFSKKLFKDPLDRDSDYDDDDVIAVEATLEDVLSIPTDLDDNCPTPTQSALPTPTRPVQDKTVEVDGGVSKAQPRVDEVPMTTKSKIERVLEQSNVVLLESEAIGDEGGTRTVWSTADVRLKRSRKRSEEVATRLLCICNVLRGLSFLPGNATEIFRNRNLMRSLAGLMLIRHKHRKLANRATLGRDQDSSRVGDTPKDSYQCFGGPSSNQQVNEYSWFTPKRPVTSSTRRSHRIYSSTVLDDREESSDVYNDTWWWNHVRRMREDAMVILCNITHCIDLSELPDDHTALALLEACLHWSICPSSEASDPFNLEDPSSLSISPQNISLEILTKLSLKDPNVDLILATRPYSRIEKLFSNLITLIGDRKELALREYSFVLLSSLAAGDVVAARAIALQKSSVNTLISFLEECDMNGQSSSNLFASSSQPSNHQHSFCGTPSFIILKCAKILLSLAKVEENKSNFIRYSHRLMDLSMSQVLSSDVTKVMSSILFEISDYS